MYVLIIPAKKQNILAGGVTEMVTPDGSNGKYCANFCRNMFATTRRRRQDFYCPFFPYDSQSIRRQQQEQIVVRARHIFLPWARRFMCSIWAIFAGRNSDHSACACSSEIDLSSNPMRLDIRRICVSTGKTSISHAKSSTQWAVFGPTPLRRDKKVIACCRDRFRRNRSDRFPVCWWR